MGQKIKSPAHIDEDAHGHHHHFMPKLKSLTEDSEAIKAWAWKKGDNFFMPNHKRFIIISGNVLYWANGEHQEYPCGGLLLVNDRVHVTRHQTTLRIKSSNKE